MALTCETFLDPPGPRIAPGSSPAGRPSVVAGATPEALLGILRPGVQLAIWDRPLPASLRRGAATLCAAPFAAVLEAPVADLLPALARRLPPGAPEGLLPDIHGLALLFAGLTDRTWLRLRLEVVGDAACRRFHADAVSLRLLCTYRGPATEWLPLPGGAAATRALPEPPPVPARRLGTGAVALLKGEAHPGQAGMGCIHRSPPCPPGGPARLLLCLDEPGRIPLP
ncbi:DUF1826 domain-containing protein [Pseudoroseomonas sp. WGS1072]|uniref:DUF1826 domain-containing protein n=1 Tax=Roseomonas sp. WGS1072 TaxID=3366816 RepID=UPI003BF0F80A